LSKITPISKYSPLIHEIQDFPYLLLEVVLIRFGEHRMPFRPEYPIIGEVIEGTMRLKVKRSILIVVLALFVILQLNIGLLWAAGPTPEKGSAKPEGMAKTPQPRRTETTVTGKGKDYPYEVIDNSECLGCHKNKINERKFAESVHGAESCNSCHWDITTIKDHVKAVERKGAGARTEKVKCQWCHDEEALNYYTSVHFLNGLQCTDCHTNIHQLAAWKGDKKSLIQTCETCHPDEGERYSESVHGKGLLAGNPDSPDCTDCHGHNKSLHEIPVLKGREARTFHTEACAKCHADETMMKRNKVFPIATQTYYESYHGKIEELGYPRLVAGCSDCHLAHDILPPDNPTSSISPEHLVGTCKKCHSKADANFVKFDTHVNYKNPKEPILYWTFLFMHALLAFVFGGFWLHTFLWWRKDFWEHRALRAKGIFFPQLVSPDEEGQIYRRFGSFEIVLHIAIMVSFMGLVLTGLPLEFSSAPWARGLIHLVGGSPTRGIIHRICAIIVFTTFGTVVVTIFYFLFFKKIQGEPNLLKRFFGPDSLFPRWKDMKDIIGMFRWFFNRGPVPRFDRWTYWEKFDFLAVFWGMLTIGFSGLMLWFRGFFSIFLPGWILNMATIVHSDEALLAAGFIFTIHFFNNHFRPSNFPINTVIFTGRLPKYKLIEERQAQYERMLAEKTLETYRDKYPGVAGDLLSEIFGFAMLAIGLLCLYLIGSRFLG
jgi:cytochrome b subunit of formate dehydrogenase